MTAFIIPGPDRPRAEIKRFAFIKSGFVHPELFRWLSVDCSERRRFGHEDRRPGGCRAAGLPIFVLLLPALAVCRAVVLVCGKTYFGCDDGQWL